MYSILIVEDEAIVRKGITRLIDFERMGISVVKEAENGRQAWELFQSWQPDILLTDINMPQMDGLSLAKRVKEMYPQVHIVFLTGYDYVDYLLSALRLGADDYLLKPITKKEVEAFLVKVVAKLSAEYRHSRLEQILQPQETAEEDLSKYVQEQLGNPELSLSWLAQKLNFSPNYLSTLFKKQTGQSFQDYVTTQRMQKAKLLLLSTTMKVYEVAQAVGIEDVNYFSARFKQIVGQTPKQFQKGVSV